MSDGRTLARMLCGREIKIHTNFEFPPVPWRHDDWSAVTDDYDGAEDSGNRYQIGRGRTEEEAIKDLLAILEDEE